MNDLQSANPAPHLLPFAPNLGLLRYPLKRLGVDLQRNVAVVRLESGDLALLSSGPFSPSDVAEIRAFGNPRWLVEGMLRHDTFSREGWEAFPGITFLAPEGFTQKVDFPVAPLLPAPTAWTTELQALELQGMPDARETVFFHAASRTLIVEDLAFNFPGEQPLGRRIMMRLAVGSHLMPAVPRSVPLQTKDSDAFESSLAQLFAWNFDRLIVGHGEPIETNAKSALLSAVRDAGFSVLTT